MVASKFCLKSSYCLLDSESNSGHWDKIHERVLSLKIGQQESYVFILINNKKLTVRSNIFKTI